MVTKTTNGITTKYVYGLGLIGEEKCGEFKTYHFDYRGSTVAITDECGNITDTFKYDTYGKVTEHIGSSFIIFGYNGRDGVVTDRNGLLYMRARYYSPEMRRFINADIIPGEISNAVTLNRYAYANGNPVSNVDPFGLFSIIIAPQMPVICIEKETERASTLAKELANEIGSKAFVENGTISISMEDEEEEILKVSSILGMKETCDLIAEAACDKFYDENKREFLLSDDCVSKEIFDHVEAYLWAVGKKLLPNYLALGFIANLKLNGKEGNKEIVYEATKSIDMRECDIIKPNGSFIDKITSQAYLFDYKNGLRKDYMGTEYDPWASERK